MWDKCGINGGRMLEYRRINTKIELLYDNVVIGKVAYEYCEALKGAAVPMITIPLYRPYIEIAQAIRKMWDDRSTQLVHKRLDDAVIVLERNGFHPIS
jgi:hypothetical protein